MRTISQYIASENNAGPKAKVDVERILKKKYKANIYTNIVKSNCEDRLSYKLKKIIFMYRYLNTNDIVVIQIPFSNKLGFLNLAKNKIGVVHDIDGIRFNDKKLLELEVKALNTFKVLIVHNEEMEKELKKNGVIVPMIKLELFDYLVKYEIKYNYKKVLKGNPVIVYPGNLEPRKSEFLYSLNEDKMKFKISAYGSCYEKIDNKKIVYKGSYSPDELPEKLKGDLGLVWAGKIDSSDGNIGEKRYNKYNSPHKLSCFILAGIPVIVWDKSAAAKIVDKYNIGYKISKLYDINNIDLSDYETKRKNVIELSALVKNGKFFIRAFDEAIAILQEKRR